MKGFYTLFLVAAVAMTIYAGPSLALDPTHIDRSSSALSRGQNMKLDRRLPLKPPDLAIQRIWLDPQCRIAVQVANLGGPVPERAYEPPYPVGIVAYSTFPDNPDIGVPGAWTPWGGYGIAMVDKKGIFKQGRGVVDFVAGFKRPLQHGESRLVKVSIFNRKNALGELNASNNSMTVTLRCP